MFWLIPNKVKFLLCFLFIIFTIFSWQPGLNKLPLLLIIAGGMCNFTVVVANKWVMPARKIKNYEKHKLLNPKNAKFMDKEEAKLYWLSDIHYHFGRLISKGDFLIFTGLAIGLIRFL